MCASYSVENNSVPRPSSCGGHRQYYLCCKRVLLLASQASPAGPLSSHIWIFHNIFQIILKPSRGARDLGGFSALLHCFCFQLCASLGWALVQHSGRRHRELFLIGPPLSSLSSLLGSSPALLLFGLSPPVFHFFLCWQSVLLQYLSPCSLSGGWGGRGRRGELKGPFPESGWSICKIMKSSVDLG